MGASFDLGRGRAGARGGAATVNAMTLAAIDFGINAIVQIGILAAIFLYIYGILRGTRSEQMLWGVVVIAVALYAVSAAFNLDVILFFLGKFPTIVAIALIVVFQPELRQAFLSLRLNLRELVALADYGSRRDVLETICSAVETMSKTRTGAIIALERGAHLREWADDATAVGAPVSRELLLSIFYPGGPLHDGGVVVKGATIVAARCVFPLSGVELGRGTRHRAGLGLSERTDAAVVVVSEETGSIAVACEGHFFKDLNRESLARLLGRIMSGGGLAARLTAAAGKEEQP